MNLFIAEDEPPARERLVEALARVAPLARVVGHSDTVQGTLAWLAANPAPQLLLMDIQLADGLSLELFRGRRLQLPTIFTTAYDQFALQAFDALAVDYLLKPVSDAALARALDKAAWCQGDLAEQLLRRLSAPRQRLVGRRGAQFHALELGVIACFVSVDKLAYAIDREGQRYQLETTLAELEATLDPRRFFRANRQLIVAAEAVRRFAPAGKGRLKLELMHPALDGELTISQERAGAFRAWLEG
ncbi:LytTR family DNA-binding domain-containing protein [Pelomonas sp. KK5]|uniref:LytR/AlgR family response regulator transcription factor n=1 Tax=Pelomonas sp. KK5 TaxID=1855730 RepID=UPI00097C68E0|nr:LytTR family DNA-binding domain-containing protein [Pelomonas sp. KK5]